MSIRIALLGDLEVSRDGVPRAIPAGGRAAVLMILALAAPRSVSRDKLIDAMWGDRPPATAVNAIQVHVSALRKVLGPDVIATSGDGYRLRGDVVVDVAQFDSAARRGRAELEEGFPEQAARTFRLALALWRGTALCDAGDAAFAQSAAARLEEDRLNVVEARVNADLSCGRAAELVPELESLVRDHPYREGLLAQLMQALYRSGRQADALGVYEAGRRLLAEELGLDPSLALRELHHRILDQSEPAPATANYLPDATLPAVLDTTVGRDEELVVLEGMVRSSDARLVSIVGPGGVGKTRLATELGHRLDGFRDGVVFVPLGEATRSEDVATTLCAALHLLVTENAQVTLERGLAARESVLICDNFEHVAAAAPLLVRLLAVAPRVRIVVTSRQLLGVRGERPFHLTPLSYDKGGQAAELFLTRVRESDPSFVPTDRDIADAAVIAERCDGLPLALELAASRTRVFSVAELRASLADPLALSAVGVQDRPGRHLTMRGNIAWSIEGLAGAQADFLRAMTVFRGGFTASAAAAVAGVAVEDAVSEIAALCDRSLVYRSPLVSDQRRFDMLVSVRDYSAESLDEDARAALRARHAAFFRDFLRPPPDPGVPSESVERWLAKLAERANLRDAVRYALDTADSQLAGEMVIAAASLWYHAGSRPDLTEWLTTLVARVDVMPERRCDALVWLSILWGDDDPAQQRAPLTEALELATSLGDLRRRAFVLWQLATLSYRDHTADGKAFACEALDLVRQMPEAAVLESSILSALGMLAAETDADLALVHMRESVQISRDRGLDLRRLVLLNNLAELHFNRGEPIDAYRCATEGVELAVRAQSALGLADHLGQRGTASLLLGRPADAVSDLGEAIRVLLSLGQTFFALQCLERFAAAVSDRHPDIATIAIAVVDSSAEYSAEFLSSTLRGRYLVDLPARIGTQRWEEFDQRGREMTEDLGTLAAMSAVLDLTAQVGSG